MANITVTEKIDGVYVGVVYLDGGKGFYDVCGETIEELISSATELAESIGLDVEAVNTEIQEG